MNCNDAQLKFIVYIINQIAQTQMKPTNVVFKYISLLISQQLIDNELIFTTSCEVK